MIRYSAMRRRREFGVRAALGAGPWRIAWLVCGEPLGVWMLGVAVGSVGGIVFARLWTPLVADGLVSSSESWAIVLFVFLFALVAALWSPARAAARGDLSRVLVD